MGASLRAPAAGILSVIVVLAGCSAPADDGPTPSAAPSDDPIEDSAKILVLTGAEIGATASAAVDDQIDGTFEILCEEGAYEVTVGTQLTCTYADDNGDTPAYIEITAVEGSQYELSVSVR